MWLINVYTYGLEEFVPERSPPFAILSHRWEEDEVPHKEMKYHLHRARTRNGFRKIEQTCREARLDQLEYAWVDTCCIDKRSSAELSEAINSMFSWYNKASVCYVYLSDVRGNPFQLAEFQQSAWFSRGWTLQELLAPQEVRFYDRDWWRMGHKEYLIDVLHSITGIAKGALGGRDLREFPVSEKMSWAARRRTTRCEDMAYCLLGIFDVNMPLLYGEGEKAFLRLQEEIIRHSNDHSIFNWKQAELSISGLLAPSISCFAYATPARRYPEAESRPFTLTNQGVSAQWSIHPWMRGIYVTFADCYRQKDWAKLPIFLCPPDSSYESSWRRIHLNKDTEEASEYQCFCSTGFTFWSPATFSSSSQERLIVVPQVTQYIYEYPYMSESSSLSFQCPMRLGFTVKCRPFNLKSSFHVLRPPFEPGDKWRTFEEAVEISLPPGRYGLVCLIKPLSSDDRLGYVALGYDFEMHPFVLAMGSDSTFVLDSPDPLRFKDKRFKELLHRDIMKPVDARHAPDDCILSDHGDYAPIWRLWPNEENLWAARGSKFDSNFVLALRMETNDTIAVKHLLQVQFRLSLYLSTGCLVIMTPVDPQLMKPSSKVLLDVGVQMEDVVFQFEK